MFKNLEDTSVFKYVKAKKDVSKRKNYPTDVVILHQFPRGPRAPSVSPFALKLETWLRMAGIKYQNEFTNTGRSPKGKIPWITFNDVDIADSQFIIEFLEKRFNKDLSRELSPYEKSLARSFLKMTEESLRWAAGVHRFAFGKPEDIGFNPLLFRYASSKFLKEAHGQGYARHSQDELYEIARTDLKALENFIGDKTYLMGDRVCNEDASVFGALVQVIYHDRGPLNLYVMGECPNILRYVDQIKTVYWPDWNENITEKRK